MSTARTVTFEWPHHGGHVQLAGSFTSWNPVDMCKDPSSQCWSVQLKVPAGKHEYKFVIDGQEWIHDHDQPTVKNEVGSFNNFIDVEMVQQTIEVERKFIVPDTYDSLLTDSGFVLVKEFVESLVDDYFDTPDLTLMKNDHWLRKRNGDWELKYPVGSSPRASLANGSLVTEEENAKHHTTTVYHETSNSEDILSKLRSLPDEKFQRGDDDTSAPSLVKLLEQCHLTSFAKLKTDRKCYKRNNVNIVVDITDWGFRVGEIEIVVESKAEVHKAVNQIQDLADKMGLTTVREGKMSSYLKLKNPTAYQILSENILGKKMC